MLQSIPVHDRWTAANDLEPGIKLRIDHFYHKVRMNQLTIVKLTIVYHKVIAQNLLYLFNDKLFYLESINVSTNFICRIIVTLFISLVIFNLVYASPAASHMGEY